LDTRTKIVASAKARTLLADGNWLVVAGYFDPLTAAVAQRLHDLTDPGRNEKVLAIVLDGPETLLTTEARSYLIAALRKVDAVAVMPEQALKSFVPRHSRVRFIFDRDAELRNTGSFEALVSRKERFNVHSSEPGS